MRVLRIGLLLLIMISTPNSPILPAQNHQEIDRTIGHLQPTSWELDVSRVPAALYGDIQVNRTGNCEIYVVDTVGFQDWQSRGIAENPVSWASFQDANLTFWEPITSTGTYYLAIRNHGDEPVRVTGYWGVDDDGPSIVIEPGKGETVEGIVSINITGTDVRSGVLWTSLQIRGTLVENVTGGNLTYDWDTTALLDGQYTLTAFSMDTVGILNTESVDVTVDNIPNGVEPNNVVLWQWGFAVLVIAVVALVLVIRWRGPTETQPSSSFDLDDFASKEEWAVMFSAIEQVFANASEDSIWYLEIVKALESLIEAGTISISYLDARKALEILGNAGLLVWLDDDTLRMPDDYGERKSLFHGK
ncbi:MAG: Ig-like domain-containing protein [Candidatus Thorarchaeota archaeon]